MGILTTWPSPAKINLFLHINGRRQDGYHELQTVFAILDKGDEITIEETDDNKIIVKPDLGFPMEDNIVYKAAMALKNEVPCNKGATITINKNIPMGGGLGGGSSNAATTLCALNAIWQLNISQTRLEQLGRKLGADVPVFVRGESTFADGVGEVFTPIEVEQNWCLVVTPKDTHVSTKEIFMHPELPRNTPKIKPQDFVLTQTRNDCEELVKKYYPNIAITLNWLIKYAQPRMTGTGASCFALFDSKSQALNALSEMPKNLDGFIARICEISPLKEKISQYQASLKI